MLMGYTEEDATQMCQDILESAIVLRDIHNHDKLVKGLLEAHNLIDGLICEGRI
jgi:hypothetical protein